VEDRTLRVRFLSGRLGSEEFRRFVDWHVALRDAKYGHTESIEPWAVVNDQIYTFRSDSVEFLWFDFAMEGGLAEAARNLGGMIVEALTDNGTWEPVGMWKDRAEGIVDVLVEEKRERDAQG